MKHNMSNVADILQTLVNKYIPNTIDMCTIHKDIIPIAPNGLMLRLKAYEMSNVCPKPVGGVSRAYYIQELELAQKQDFLTEYVMSELKELLFDLVLNIRTSERSETNGGLKVNTRNEN